MQDGRKCDECQKVVAVDDLASCTQCRTADKFVSAVCYRCMCANHNVTQFFSPYFLDNLQGHTHTPLTEANHQCREEWTTWIEQEVRFGVSISNSE